MAYYKQLNNKTIMEKTFVRVRSAKDITICVSLIIAGSILIALPTGAAVNITGFFLIFAGIILALVMKTGYKDLDTGMKYQKEEHFFQQAMHAAISTVLASNPDALDLSEEDKGNAIRLDVYYSRQERHISSFLNMFHTNMNLAQRFMNMRSPR